MTRHSKCDICRARKVKCDEKRPCCSQCEKRARSCTYSFAQACQGNGHSFHDFANDELRQDASAPALSLKSTRRSVDGRGVFLTFESKGKGSSKRELASRRYRLKDSQHTLAGNNTRLDLWETAFPLSSPPDPSDLNRTQLKALLLEDEFPPDSLFRKKIFNVHSANFVPDGRAMRVAGDYVLMLYHDRLKGDVTHHPETQRQYLSAVEHLRQELQAPNAVSSDSVLGAIDTLSLACQFRGAAAPHDSWITHVKGLEDIIAARGPSLLKSAYAKTVLLNFTPILLIKGLSNRQPLFLGNPEWQTEARPYCDRSMSHLALVAARLPTLMHEIDIQVQHDPDVEKLKTLLENLVSVQHDLNDWRQAWFVPSATSDGLVGYYPADLEMHMPAFIAHFNSLVSNVFPFKQLPFIFDNQVDAFRYSWYWLGLLECERAIFDTTTHLHRSKAKSTFPSLESLLMNPELVAHSEKCEELATNIARAVPALYLAKTEFSYAPVAITTTLTFAGAWFAVSGQKEKSQWCDVVTSEMKDREWGGPSVVGKRTGVRRGFQAWPLFGSSPLK